MIELKAYAKINLALNVLGRRSDGYHELQMVMQSVSLADKISISATAESGIKLSCNQNVTDVPEANLAYQAAELYLQKINREDQGLVITIDKQIPVAAGLAGGSTDCAAVLQGLNKMFDNKLSLLELSELANALGSDIAFCLRGGTMLATGRGEILTTLPKLPKFFGLLLKPPFSLATAEVYQNIESQSLQKLPSSFWLAYRQGFVELDKLERYCHNDLYAIAQKLNPQLSDFLEIVLATNPIVAQMSGSGPTIFGIYPSKLSRDQALDSLSGYQVFPIESVDHGYEFN